MIEYPYLTCEHPRLIHTKYGERITVPCGKCDCCKMIKSDIKQYLIQSEIDSHMFNYFVTLTYNNGHLPCGSDGVSILLKSDVQKFIKRFRIYALRTYKRYLKRYKISIEDAEKIDIRYFACGEYGPTNTVRPHYHLVLHTNSRHVSYNINKLLHKAWKLGFVRWRRVRKGHDKVKEYVSSYINCPIGELSLTSRSLYPPFQLHSQFYGERVIKILAKEIYEDVRQGTVKRSYVYNNCEVYPYTSFKVSSSIFPRCYGFSVDDFRTRLRSYELFEYAREEYPSYLNVFDLAKTIWQRYIFITDIAVRKSCPTASVYAVLWHYENDLHLKVTLDSVYHALLVSRYFINSALDGDLYGMLKLYDRFYSFLDYDRLFDQLSYEESHPYCPPYLLYRNYFDFSVYSDVDYSRRIVSTRVRYSYKDKSKKLNSKFIKL